jgi:hypothetical protein
MSYQLAAQSLYELSFDNTGTKMRRNAAELLAGSELTMASKRQSELVVYRSIAP